MGNLAGVPFSTPARSRFVNDATKSAVAADVQVGVSLYMVTNMTRSLAFWIDGLGFTVKNKWVVDDKIRWCWLERGTAAIMLQEYGEAQAAKLTGQTLGLGVQIYFQSSDAVALYREFKTRGIDVSEPQVGNGNWEIFLRDPDGYKVAFCSPTDVPEETKLSELKKPS
jgi:catechol 2,3-dioxygenase-like lactoylglutathione lyase family enzyme